MGHVEHDAVIVTTSDYREGGLPDLDAFRASLPPEFARLVIGPIESVTNGYVSYAFLPDGSKSGWNTDAEGREFREAFVALFGPSRYSDGSTPDDIVELTFGADFQGVSAVLA